MPNSRSARYLKFLARLYELAADFDQRQLMGIQRVADSENNKPVSTAASMLMELRGDKSLRADSLSRIKTSASGKEGLREVLCSKKVFSSNAALVAFARRFTDLSEKPKEPRNRLVTRILGEVENGADKERAAFWRALEEHIARQNGGSDFVSRWTKIIQGL